MSGLICFIVVAVILIGYNHYIIQPHIQKSDMEVEALVNRIKALESQVVKLKHLLNVI